jgi:hypothetical protein
MPGNPIDSALGAPSAAPPSAAPNPIDATLGGSSASATPPTQNPIDSALRNPIDQDSDGEAQRLGEGQSWLTKPLQTSLFGVGEYRQGATGIEKGVEKFASGLLSPVSIGLMLVTGGLGSLAEAGAATAGEEAATSLSAQALSKLAPETAASVAKAAGVVSKLANAGFTGQQILAIADKEPLLAQAIKDGNSDKAMELGTSMLLEGVAARLSTQHLMKMMNPTGEPVWTQDKDVIAASQQPQQLAGAKALAFRKANEALIKNTPLDMAARLYHEAGQDPATLERWRQEIVDDNNIKPAIQQKYDTLLKQAQNLPDEVKKLSSQLRVDYATDLTDLKAAGKFHPNSNGAPNYAGQHKYVFEDEGGSSLRYTGLRKLTKSPEFTKPRSFDTVVDAIKAGYEPKEIGLAGAREEYIRNLGEMHGAIDADNKVISQTADDNRPVGIDPARVRVIDGKKVIPVEQGAEVGAIGERRADADTRQRIDDMTPEEREQAIRGLRPGETTLKPSAFRMTDEQHRPEDFLRRVVGKAATEDEIKAAVVKEGASDLEIQNLRDAYKAGQKIEPVQVTVDKNGDVVDSSGLHRAYAAMQAGIEKIPVERRTLKEPRAANSEPAPGKWPSGLDPIADKQIIGRAIAEVTKAVPGIPATIGFDELGPKAQQQVIKRALDMKVDEKTANSPTATAVRKPSLAPSGAKVIAHNGKLYWNVDDYQPGPDTFKRWRYRTTDKYGNAVFDSANTLIHPDYHEQIMQAFQDNSWFRKNPIMRSLLGASMNAKASLLTASPFHWNTMWQRGIQMGLSPLEALRPNEITPDRLAVTAKYGPTLSVANQRSLVAEGLASNKLINKLPGVGKLMGNLEERLFGGGGYIDRLKADAFDKVTAQIAKRHTNWTGDQVQFASSKIVDAAFGGLNWKMLGASMNGVDALRLIALAPDFTGSQVLFAKHGVEPGGSVIGQSLMRIALYNFGVARALNMLTTGQLHVEHPFSVVSPDGKKIYSIRTMPQDILHAMTDPRGFAYNRVNPLLVRTSIEAITGRDEQGKQADYQKQLHDLLRNVLPISSQNFVPSFRREGEGIGTSVLRSVGVNSEPNTTSAYKLSSQLASGKSESGPVDTDKLEHHQHVLQMEDALRSGALKPEDLNAAIEHQTISIDDAKQIWENYKVTQGMDEYNARLYTRATRLPMKDFFQVWDVATPAEKQVLLPLLEKKGKDYLRTSQKKMVQTERDSDPTYKRVRRDLAHLPLW